ncbi:MAG: hypothetical protein J6R42_05605 [Clostridia bacterium]|nr:hypothetical protein [Clostridia bacterium]
MKLKNILKSKKFIMAAAMVLMVSLVVGMGAMTYARYITSDADTAQATVAKWGFVVTVDAQNMFGTAYEDNAIDADGTVGEGHIDVKAAGQTTIIAPGTSGSLTFSVNGTAEVLAQLSAAIDNENSSVVALAYTENSAEKVYNPIKWTLTVNDNGNETTPVNAGTFDELITGLALNRTIAIGEALNLLYTISWEWELDTENDDLDTALGMLANAKNVVEGSDEGAKATLLAAIKAQTGVQVVLAKSNLDLEIAVSATVKQIQD